MHRGLIQFQGQAVEAKAEVAVTEVKKVAKATATKAKAVATEVKTAVKKAAPAKKSAAKTTGGKASDSKNTNLV